MASSGDALLKDTSIQDSGGRTRAPGVFFLLVAHVTSWAMTLRELVKSSYVSLEPKVERKARKGMKEHVRKQHEVQTKGCYWNR